MLNVMKSPDKRVRDDFVVNVLEMAVRGKREEDEKNRHDTYLMSC